MNYITLNNSVYFEKIGHYAGVREGAATDVYAMCGLIKVIPRSKISQLLVHHLSNKYVTLYPEFNNRNDEPDDLKMVNLERMMT